MATGEAGSQVVSALRPVEEDHNISPGAVTPQLQLMGGSFVKGIILGAGPATTNNVS